MIAPRQVILVGAFIEIVELCDAIEVEVVGFIDNSRREESFLGRPILGNDGDAQAILRRWPTVPVHVTPNSPKLRRKLSGLYSQLGASFATSDTPDRLGVALGFDRSWKRDSGPRARVLSVDTRSRRQS